MIQRIVLGKDLMIRIWKDEILLAFALKFRIYRVILEIQDFFDGRFPVSSDGLVFFACISKIESLSKNLGVRFFYIDSISQNFGQNDEID